MKIKKAKFAVIGRKARLEGDKYFLKMREFFSYSAPGARFSPTYRAGAWDGRIHMMQRKEVNVGLLHGLEDELIKADWKIKIKEWKNRPKIKVAKKGIIAPKENYDYQNRCIKQMLEAIKWGGGLILSATGTGKTAMAAMFSSWAECPILFVVDQINLLHQSKKEIEHWLSEFHDKKVKVGIVGASNYDPARITIATIQTLQAHRYDPKFLAWFRTIEVVLIDEVHVQMARRNFDVMNIIKPKAVFGLTATLQLRKKPVRMRAFSLCGPPIFEFPIKEATKQGVLSKGCALVVDVDCGTEIQDSRPDWHMDIHGSNRILLDYKVSVIKNKRANKATVEIVRSALKKGYYVAVLVDRIRHLGLLKRLFKEAGFDPQVAFGGVDNESRKRRQKRFEKGKSRLFLASRVFTKGVNIKRLDLIVDVAQRPNKDDVLQKYGRGVRLHQEKEGLIFITLATLEQNYENKEPRTLKAAKSRFNALKKAEIPVERIKYESGKKTLKAAEKLLSSILEKGRK
jgi:superfamily II DNA or RNA helicase